jgi:hypothetical protein
VQSIRGTALLPQPGDYQVILTAEGLGYVDGVTPEITATLNGADVKFTEINQTQQKGQAVLLIPNSVIAPLFAPNALRVISLNLTVTITKKEFFHKSSKSYPFPVYLLLYPAKVATVNVTMTAPSFNWVDIGNTPSAVFTTPDKNGCKFCDTACTAKNTTSTVVPGVHAPLVPGDERIVSATLSCTPGNLCVFEAFSRRQISITNNGARATVNWETCTRPANYTLDADTQQWQNVGSATTSNVFDLVLDTPQVVTLPDGTTLTVLDVSSFTKQKYRMILGQLDPHSIITAQQQPGTQNLIIAAIPPNN